MFGLFRRLFRSEEGSNLAYTAFIIIPLIGAAGVGTDAGRGYLLRAKLSQALDAAALAGAHKTHSNTEMEADVRQFFKANFPDGYMDATITGPTFSYDDEADTITVTASAKIPTTFMRVLGHDWITVSASTEVTRHTNYMDVVMSIDMSGSMASSAPGGGTRIEAARNAANELVSTLFGSQPDSELLKIGVVPWNGKVNVVVDGVPYDPGQNRNEVVGPFKNPITGKNQTLVYRVNHSPVPLLSNPKGNWRGCVYARFTDNGVDDDGDTVDGDVEHSNGDWVAWEPVGDEGEPVANGICSSSTSTSDECTPCLVRGIFPLNNQRGAISAFINSLTQPTGTTNIAQGLMWAARVLSPEAPYSEADPDPDGPRTQAIVLLTDGAHVRDYGDAYKRQLTTSELDARLRLIASNIKAKGILIYTIQFANGGGSSQEQLMKDVASQPKSPYYHFAPTAQELQNVFQTISKHLAKLRISK
jgi:Flp pilus assembly protein TadG